MALVFSGVYTLRELTRLTHTHTHTRLCALALSVYQAASSRQALRHWVCRLLRLRLLRGYMNRYIVASTCLILIMCMLFDTVARILRACGVPWTGARRRYALVYCTMGCLQCRQCSPRRLYGGRCTRGGVAHAAALVGYLPLDTR